MEKFWVWIANCLQKKDDSEQLRDLNNHIFQILLEDW